MKPSFLGVLSLALLAVLPLPVAGALPHDGDSFTSTVVAGGDEDFLTVRHLVLSGTQREIGRRLAELAMERHGWSPSTTDAPVNTRAQRTYFAEHAPLFLERMRGVADAAGVDVEDDSINVSGLGFGFTKPGCTVTYYPPHLTEWGTGVVSRNFDFTTGTMRGRQPGPDEIPVVASPYVLETHPEDGYATIALVAYDFLGVVDGMNSEGLTMALLADDEVAQRYGTGSGRPRGAGFNVLQIGRHVLETCADVEEAQAALRAAELYYGQIPCHYLVADRHGRSFVWENAVDMSTGYVIDGEGEAQVTTNFMQHLHPDARELPAGTELVSLGRFQEVHDRIAEHAGEVDLDFVRATSACVSATHATPPAPAAVGRTLWHALYFPEERRLEVDFYLGESADGIRRSEPVAFELVER
jgi:hypothetical protein